MFDHTYIGLTRWLILATLTNLGHNDDNDVVGVHYDDDVEVVPLGFLVEPVVIDDEIAAAADDDVIV